MATRQRSDFHCLMLHLVSGGWLGGGAPVVVYIQDIQEYIQEIQEYIQDIQDIQE